MMSRVREERLQHEMSPKIDRQQKWTKRGDKQKRGTRNLNDARSPFQLQVPQRMALTQGALMLDTVKPEIT
jgi:hypothetical protein